MTRMDRYWYAVQVRAKSEAMVAALLTYKGYDVFLPTYPREHTRRKESPRALFPGYLFCRNGEQVSGLVVTTPGVVQLLGAGAIPQPVPDAEIENLQRVLASGQPIVPLPKYEPGMTARLIGGPLTGCSGVILQVQGETHLVVSIELLRRSVSVAIERRWVEGLPPVTVTRLAASRHIVTPPAVALSAGRIR